MKKISLLVPSLLLMGLPLVASAHEHATYVINGVPYQIVIGSLNEPVAVDDKTGVDLTVNKCFTSACAATKGPDGDIDGPAGTPVAGLESSLKVELVAGDQKKSLALFPQYGSAGKYTAAFHPTVATTFAYHFTGAIAGTPVDLTYTCAPAGSSMSSDNTTPVKLSDKVTQTSMGGAFGCPVAKEDLGFPEPSASLTSLNASVSNAKSMGDWGIGAGVVGMVLAGTALWRRRV